MTFEQGKPVAEAEGEITYAASFIEWFAEQGKRTNGEIIPSPSSDKRLMVIKTRDWCLCGYHTLELPCRHDHP